MMAKKEQIRKLNCGIEIKESKNNKTQFGSVSIMDLYNGYGELSDLNKASVLFKELADEGWKVTGLYREIGYYDSTDDLILELIKK